MDFLFFVGCKIAKTKNSDQKNKTKQKNRINFIFLTKQKKK